MLLKFEKDVDMEKLAEEFSREGKGHFDPFSPCELGFMHIMNLHLLPVSSCTLQLVEVLPFYILRNLDFSNLDYFLEKLLACTTSSQVS